MHDSINAYQWFLLIAWVQVNIYSWAGKKRESEFTWWWTNGHWAFLYKWPKRVTHSWWWESVYKIITRISDNYISKDLHFFNYTFRIKWIGLRCIRYIEYSDFRSFRSCNKNSIIPTRKIYQVNKTVTCWRIICLN